MIGREVLVEFKETERPKPKTDVKDDAKKEEKKLGDVPTLE